MGFSPRGLPGDTEHETLRNGSIVGWASAHAACSETQNMKRYGMAIRIKPDNFEEYKRLHAEVWPDVLKMITECNIKNYSIFHKDGMMFSYFEYVGEDFDSDMAKMAADPATQKWWGVCKPLLEPLETRKEGEFWADMEEVFHCQ